MNIPQQIQHGQQPAMMMGDPNVRLVPMIGPDGRPQLGPDGRQIMQPMRVPFMQPGHGGFPGGQPMFQPGPGMNYQGHIMSQGHPGGPGTNQMQPGMNQRGFNSNVYAGGPQMNQPRMANPITMPNPNAQNDQQSTYAATQECWGNFTGWIATYLCCCCCDPPYKIVPQGHTGIIQRFGKFYKLVAPGMHYLNPDLDTLVLVDKREQVVNLHRQQVTTRDSISTTIDAVLYYRVIDSYKSKFAVSNIQAALNDLVQTTLRNVIGRMTLQDVLEKRDDLSEQILEHVTIPAFNWGALLTRALIQEIFLPRDQLANMSQGAISKKLAEAKLIQSKADVESARLMKEASEILSTDAAMQIRYVESLESLSRTNNPKMVFFPADYREIGSMNEDLADETTKLL